MTRLLWLLLSHRERQCRGGRFFLVVRSVAWRRRERALDAKWKQSYNWCARGDLNRHTPLDPCTSNMRSANSVTTANQLFDPTSSHTYLNLERVLADMMRPPCCSLGFAPKGFCNGRQIRMALNKGWTAISPLAATSERQ